MGAPALTDPTLAASLWRAWLEGPRRPERMAFDLIDRGQERVGERSRVPPRLAPAPDVSRLHPFAQLRSWTPASETDRAIPILVIAPMSGAFGHIVRDMASAFREVGPVHVLEWINARHVAASNGGFTVDDQVEVIAQALRRVEPKPHMVALCQSGPATLRAAALQAGRGADRAPCSLTLIAAPMDVSAAHTPLSARLSGGFGFAALGMAEAAMVWRRTVYGDRRRVLPAEAQVSTLAALLAARDPDHDELSRLMLEAAGEMRRASGEAGRSTFIHLATAFMDLPAEFVLDNMRVIYRGAALSAWRGVPINLRWLAQTPILTIEGGRDTVTAPGQTRAALAMAPGVAARRAFLAPELGHFGLFLGRGFQRRVYPELRRFWSQVSDTAPQPGANADASGAPDRAEIGADALEAALDR
ncbi:MAG: hypothetical protein AAF909_02680 [Pseudomonadota bacterium]